ncbi:CPBP family intramembrane glutamic endopeptidase [Levilactobacillus suantsaii]|uniref:CPBP family intramembrane metalloprotease n=1 Tax=Levilactobacillus suantsaii TaxID=2292255 RepID=A0A4Q0VG51_9LACO|nr:CPBP family intramembrane glutamic endopeptidase [Levilactobacillus suantsaii]QMU08443.1 CPBP family intramembrane metalloprotease [Levilactobacillus suantsaii]RXI77549.1 CPBP family intramembrane metalloprotease [Levilactobacillus suantsaii]
MQGKAVLHLSGVCALSVVVMLGLGLLGHLRQLADPTDVVLQDGILLVMMVGLNLEWLQVPVFFRSELPLGQQVRLNAVPLLVMALTWLDLLGMAQNWFHPFAMPVRLALIVAGCVAVFEEYFFRGVVLTLLMRALPHHLLAAVVGSGLIFGSFHLINWVHQPLALTLLQGANAWAMGLLLAAIYLRTRALLWPILWHFTHDLGVLLLTGVVVDTRPTTSVTVGTGLAIIYVVTALVLLRPDKQATLTWPLTAISHHG